MDKKLASVSVVVPCFNEGKTIQKNLTRIHNYLKNHFEVFEIIVVDDGSSDDTLKEVRKIQNDLHLRVINNKLNEGKGKAVRQGILEGSCELIMFIDADLGIPIEELKKFIPEFEKGNDIVIASRFVPGFKIIRPVQFHRWIMEKIFRMIRMAIVNDWNIKDTQCGFKVFKKEAAMKICPKTSVKRFAFDAELVFVANKFGYKIKELPIHLQNPPSRTLRIIRDPANMILDLIKIRINDWKGKYK